ncbi:MAG TPA: L,D-transpeptidase [Anaerolineales bacterium]|nr:L,D-transpeptidase [Anaerolineales bacterium]
MDKKSLINRREFLKLGALGAGALALAPRRRPVLQTGFPDAERLARVVVGATDVYARPNINTSPTGILYEDQVVPFLREVVGTNPFRFVQRFVETPEGYIWSPNVQMTRNRPDPAPMTRFPDFADSQGFWAEVSVPYVDLVLANPPVRSPAFRSGVLQRLYYQQVMWVDEVSLDEEDRAWYRLNERSGSYGDIFWAPGEAFRLITPEDITPISPDVPVAQKKIVINIAEDVQTLSCFEGNDEVYFCRISAGRRADEEGNTQEKSATPMGTFGTSWKLHSIHMSGGASGVGWDLIGVAWPTFFATPGIAIHSTFWHANFGGEYMSRGCVNVLAEDAKFIWRWSTPMVPYHAIEVRENWPSDNLTRVEVIEF